jgi:hypothetical protein
MLNGEASRVNTALGGCTYPGLNLVQFNLSEKHMIITKTRKLKPGKVLASGE